MALLGPIEGMGGGAGQDTPGAAQGGVGMRGGWAAAWRRGEAEAHSQWPQVTPVKMSTQSGAWKVLGRRLAQSEQKLLILTRSLNFCVPVTACW